MHLEGIARQLPILLFISFDGFRFDYLNPQWSPNLYKLSKESTLGHMRSTYVTKTFPNHFTMATGLYEDEHEVINNVMFDPRLNETFKADTKSSSWWNPNGRTVPIWIANQLLGRKRGYSGSMMYPGSSTPYLDTLPHYLKEYNKVRNWTANVDSVIDWLTQPESPANFVSMYFDDPDFTGHMHGPWDQRTLASVQRVDAAAGYLLQKLDDNGLRERTNIIFVSDHGIAEVRNLIFLDDVIDISGFDMYGNSPAWSVFVRPERQSEKNEIFNRLQTISEVKHFKIYKRCDIPSEYHYSKTPRIGDFFIIVDENYELFKQKSDVKWVYPKVWGNHGWDPARADMRPLFMAYGPSFKQNYYHGEKFSNIDLFPLMVHLLGIPQDSLPNNGSLAHIADILKQENSDNEISHI